MLSDLLVDDIVQEKGKLEAKCTQWMVPKAPFNCASRSEAIGVTVDGGSAFPASNFLPDNPRVADTSIVDGSAKWTNSIGALNGPGITANADGTTADVDGTNKKGEVFKSMFRVNAHNRIEAYWKIEGLPVGVLISGFNCQNRVNAFREPAHRDHSRLYFLVKPNDRLALEQQPFDRSNSRFFSTAHTLNKFGFVR